MKSLCYIIGFALTCILTVTICGCDIDVPEDPPLVVDNKGSDNITQSVAKFRSALPSNGSKIDPNSEIRISFSSIPKNVSVNRGTIENTNTSTIKVKGPFTGNELVLEVKWDGGSETLRYFLNIEYIGATPSEGSTIKPRTDITVSFTGQPKKVFVNRGKFIVTGNTIKITDDWWNRGPLSFAIEWSGNAAGTGGSKVLKYTVSDNPIAYIERVWVNHNISVDGKKGMRIHVKITVANMPFEDGRVIAYFEHSNGADLKDLNNKFNAANGQVSVGRDFRPRFDPAVFEDIDFFMPYSEFHLGQGNWDLKFKVRVWHKVDGEFIEDESEYFTFTYRKG